MRDTGMSRPLDELGRVVIPAEIRRTMNLKPGVRLDIGVANDCIVLKRSGAFCSCCGRTSDHMLYHAGVGICEDCFSKFEPAADEMEEE